MRHPRAHLRAPSGHQTQPHCRSGAQETQWGVFRAGGDPTQHSHFIYAICSAKMVTGAPFVGPKPSGPFVAGFVSASQSGFTVGAGSQCLTAEPAQGIGVFSGCSSLFCLSIRRQDDRDVDGDARFVVWLRRRKSHNAGCDFFVVAAIRQALHRRLCLCLPFVESTDKIMSYSPRNRRFIEPALAVDHGR